MDDAELFMSLVVPAYNEEDRLSLMLSEAVKYLESEYGDQKPTKSLQNGSANGATVKSRARNQTPNGNANGSVNGHVNEYANGHATSSDAKKGWEILVVSDGSTDKTIQTALKFANGLGPPSCSFIRVVHLSSNRGKGGAVVHGMRHVRGKYTVFADADGASKFQDLGKLVRECERIEDDKGRGVAIGSRAHLVGSEAVIKVGIPAHELVRAFDTGLLIFHAAVFPAKSSHALLPPSSTGPYASRYRCHSRHPMRFQITFSLLSTLHHPLYA